MSDRQGFRKAASERAAAEDFIDAARAKIVGEVVPDGDCFRWNCECGESGTVVGESAAAVALYFHRRSGCLPADQVAVECSGGSVLPPLPPSDLSSIDDLLTPEQRKELTADLAEIAKRRRLAEGDFA